MNVQNIPPERRPEQLAFLKSELAKAVAMRRDYGRFVTKGCRFSTRLQYQALQNDVMRLQHLIDELETL